MGTSYTALHGRPSTGLTCWSRAKPSGWMPRSPLAQTFPQRCLCRLGFVTPSVMQCEMPGLFPVPAFCVLRLGLVVPRPCPWELGNMEEPHWDLCDIRFMHYLTVVSTRQCCRCDGGFTNATEVAPSSWAFASLLYACSHHCVATPPPYRHFLFLACPVATFHVLFVGPCSMSVRICECASACVRVCRAMAGDLIC